jgi:hypothetical protein
VIVVVAGERLARKFTSKAKAERYARAVRAEVASSDHNTDSARDEYECYLRAKGNRRSSIDNARYALKAFFPDPVPLDLLSERRCQHLYDTLTERLATDSHRNYLKQVKTFLRWCVAKGWMRENPADNIRGIGKRNYGGLGKVQLTNREARLYLAKGLERIAVGDERALAALLPLLLSVSGVAQLGHADYRVTQASYTTSTAPEERRRDRALRVLGGGRT